MFLSLLPEYIILEKFIFFITIHSLSLAHFIVIVIHFTVFYILQDISKNYISFTFISVFTIFSTALVQWAILLVSTTHHSLNTFSLRFYKITFIFSCPFCYIPPRRPYCSIVTQLQDILTFHIHLLISIYFPGHSFVK